MRSVRVVIVNYRTPELTARAAVSALASARAYEETACGKATVTVVDNSDDGRTADLAELCPGCEVVPTRGNPGFGAGVNAGVALGHEDLVALVRARGAGTLGWMLSWPGNEAWIADDRRTGFAYRAGSGVALTLGDPVASGPEGAKAAVEGFTAFATDAGLVPALYSVHEPTVLAAREQGWTVL